MIEHPENAGIVILGYVLLKFIAQLIVLGTWSQHIDEAPEVSLHSGDA